MGWGGMRWDAMGWGGMRWDGVGCSVDHFLHLQLHRIRQSGRYFCRDLPPRNECLPNGVRYGHGKSGHVPLLLEGKSRDAVRSKECSVVQMEPCQTRGRASAGIW